MKIIRISEEALCDLQEGYRCYEAQQKGLGERFVHSLSADIESIRFSGGRHRVIFRDYHRLLSRVFPHGIFYTCEGNEVAIWAIIDLRRDPDWSREKLSQ